MIANPRSSLSRNPRCIHGVPGCTCMDVLDEIAARAVPTTLYRCPDRPDVGPVSWSELTECTDCGGQGDRMMRPHEYRMLICDSCAGLGRVLGYDANLRPLKVEAVRT